MSLIAEMSPEHHVLTGIAKVCGYDINHQQKSIQSKGKSDQSVSELGFLFCTGSQTGSLLSLY